MNLAKCSTFIFLSPIIGLQGTITFSLLKIQFSTVAQSCSTLCDPMNRRMTGLPVHHQLLEPTQPHVHRIGDAIQPPHPLLAPFFSCLQSFPAPSVTVSIVSPSICHEDMGPDCMILVF